jgi:hypothetical protein
MKTIRLTFSMLLALALIPLLSVSCGNKEKSILTSVPSESAMVALVNTGQLLKKMNFEEFKKAEFFDKMLKELNSPQLNILFENTDKSGLDFNGQACVFAIGKESEDFEIGIIFSIKNAKALEANFEKTAKENSIFKKIESGKDFKYFESKEAGKYISMGWDKNILVVTISSKPDSKSSLDKIFNLKEEESILTNKSFNSFKIEKNDMMLWVQSDPIVKMLKKNKETSSSIKQLSFFGINDQLLNGNNMALFCNFNKGNIETTVKYAMNEQIVKEYGSILKKKIDTDFSSLFPMKNLSSITMIGLDMKGLNEVLKKRGIDVAADMYLQQNGISLEELKNGFKGEIALASYIDNSITDVRKRQKFVAALAFNNAEIIDKVAYLPKAIGVGELKKTGSRYTNKYMKDLQGIVKNNMFIISNDISVIEKIEKGGFNGDETINAATLTAMKNGWVGSHTNFLQFNSNLDEMDLELSSQFMADLLKTAMKNNELESTTSISNTENAKITVLFKNKEQNSLYTISQLINKLYLESKNMEGKKDEQKIDLNLKNDKSL